MKHLIDQALNLVITQFRLDINHGWHGISHWSRVWRNAREMCEVMDVDPTVPCLFSYLHDSQRFDEGSDSDHGRRAVQWLTGLYERREFALKPMMFHELCVAIQGHSNGRTEADEVIQICWDADRLDLGRVGIRPNPMYLCTAHAKKPEVIQQAWLRSIGEPQNKVPLKLAA